ncbi:MAG: ABC transporter ATP-binding protein, partial [Clostridia bacterium]|nr:ABC transporter ATP-binding protein [Clostridia bacterium]
MSLYVDKLSFSYKNQPVLDGISFSLASGEILVVLGENGVGKSTLLRCLCGLNKYEGQVSLDGNDLSKASPRDRAKAVGA